MSSHTIHPSYAQTDKALDHELARTTELSDEELAEALKVLSAHLSNHKTTEAIHDEIERLTNQALSINDTFDNLSRLLKSVADESKPDMKKDVEALEQRWKDHAHNYTTFLWNSRNVAGKAEATASDFATDFAEFLKDPEVTKEEKRTEMDNYLQKLDKDAASAKEASQSLADLRDGVKKFYRDWKALIKKYKPSTGNDDLAKDIAMLNTSLAMCVLNFLCTSVII
ncbi:hypothetical protein BXZ70DRAFT_292725 [Cristinia sonorae]|uniref:Uncharacterized protein n=1 Tax=Cristinia sonorae TaxID=1940300 RepID=A0A8K0UMA2_9AGAR|nr:hypothetical protein BXZ70DRAFT_292725 [Cristinia sonorae]